jgi:transcriptional regulator with XRE-family HTH domain
MKKPKIIMTILKEDTGYSASAKVNEIFIGTQGDTFEELKEMVLDAVNLAFEDLGFIYTIDEIQFKYDLESFFDFYKVINAKALSKRIGMSQSLLAQYTNGIKKPSPNQTKRILQGVQQIGRELSEVKFLL